MIRRDHELLTNIKERMSELKMCLDDINAKWGMEDDVYRYYHHSYKVFGAQHWTNKITKLLESLLPGAELNPMYLEIVKQGTPGNFKEEYNQNWEAVTRPILEALFHSKTFLENVIKYGEQLEKAPNLLPSGWALVLYLYNIR